jgi:prevent-host-death family protein
MEVMTELRKLTTGEARESFAEIVNATAFGRERVVFTRHGKEVAALVPMSDLELLQQLECIIDLEEARKALAEAQAGGTIHLSDFKKELGI